MQQTLAIFHRLSCKTLPMKKLILVAFLAPSLLFAQNDSTESQKKLIKVISISLYGGGEFYREGFEDRTIFQQAAPSSTVAYGDLAGYTTGNGFLFRYGNTNISNGINVNFRLRGQARFSELRIGLAHSVTGYAYQSYTQESRTYMGITTLPGGEIVTTDSVSYASYSYSWDADVIQLNLAWLVRTNPRAWLNAYTGFGIMGGIGYNGILEYNHIHTSHYEHDGGTTSIHYTSNREVISHTNEQYRAPMFTSFVAYIPMGFNLRLGKRNNFFKHIALFGEYTGAIQILSPKGVDSKVRTSAGAMGGVRWYIQAPGGGKARKGRQRGPHPGFPD